MNIDIIYAFMYNILILLGLAVIYSIFPVQSNHKPILRKILMGFFVFIIGFMVMINSYNYNEGIFYDARSVIISISGMFLGLIPTVIGMVGLIITRIFMGGAGVYAGVLSIFVSGGLGLLWRYYRLKNRNIDISDISIVELYLIGVLVSMFVLLSQLVLPWDTFEHILPKIILPLLVIYPLGSLFVSLFMITQRKHYFQQVAMHQSEIQYRSLFSKSSTPHILVDPKTKQIVDVNEAACTLYGYNYQELTNLHINKLNATLDNIEITEKMGKVMETGNAFFQFKHRCKDGKLIDVEVHAGPVTIENKMYLFATIIDVTSQLEQERMFRDVDERLHATLLSVGEGITVCDKYGKIQLMNNKAIELLGIEKAPVGERITEVFRIFSNAGKPAFQEVYKMVNTSQSVYRSDSSYTLLTNDNDREIFVDFTLSPININGNKNNGEILVLRDITIEKERQEELRFISQHDHLTGLYNRYHFDEQVNRLDTARQLPITIIIGDANGLKLLNDGFNHLEGDKLLIEIAEIIKRATRSEDIVSRWGGDEFAILLPQTGEKEAQIICNRIREMCVLSDYKIIQPSISLGYATKTEPTQSIKDTIRIADERMYRQKLLEGKATRNLFIASLEKKLLEKAVYTQEDINQKIQLAEQFGKQVSLSVEDINSLTFLARLHDIGTLSLSNDILTKSEQDLSKEELDRFYAHVEVGNRIILTIRELQHLAEAILYHHEKWDGSGFPHNLTEDTIPLFSRMIAIVNGYHELTKSGVSHTDALNQLLAKSEKEFDPLLVKEFIRSF